MMGISGGEGQVNKTERNY